MMSRLGAAGQLKRTFRRSFRLLCLARAAVQERLSGCGLSKRRDYDPIRGEQRHDGEPRDEDAADGRHLMPHCFLTNGSASVPAASMS